MYNRVVGPAAVDPECCRFARWPGRRLRLSQRSEARKLSLPSRSLCRPVVFIAGCVLATTEKLQVEATATEKRFASSGQTASRRSGRSEPALIARVQNNACLASDRLPRVCGGMSGLLYLRLSWLGLGRGKGDRSSFVINAQRRTNLERGLTPD
jgi:hypothetical protein